MLSWLFYSKALVKEQRQLHGQAQVNNDCWILQHGKRKWEHLHKPLRRLGLSNEAVQEFDATAFPGTPKLAIPARNMAILYYQHCGITQGSPDLKTLGAMGLAKEVGGGAA